MSKVAVLGCGPAGLLAAHAVVQEGHDLVIISPKRKSMIGGAQFIHEAIPGLTLSRPDVRVTFHKEGEGPKYQTKVYGDTPVPFVSWDGVEDGKVQDAWFMQEIYAYLWEVFHPAINDTTVTTEGMVNVLKDFDLVLSSAPLPSVCRSMATRFGPCRFTHVLINVLNGHHDHLEDNTIWYDGTDDHAYYRASKINGLSSAEYGTSSRVPPGTSPFPLRKPIATTCECWKQEGVVRIGRMGEGRKGVLVHDAYRVAREAVRAL